MRFYSAIIVYTTFSTFIVITEFVDIIQLIIVNNGCANYLIQIISIIPPQPI